jgi:lipoprotein NlpI
MIARFLRALALAVPICAVAAGGASAAKVGPGEAGVQALMEHRCQDAIDLLTEALAVDKEPLNLAIDHSNRARAYECEQRFDEAEADYTAAITLNPSDGILHSSRALLYMRLHHADLAVADFDAAIKAFPNVAGLYDDRGLAFEESGDDAAAMRDFSTALEKDPQLASAHHHRSMVLAIEDQVDQALAEERIALQIEPGNGVYVHDLAVALFETGDYGAAARGFAQSAGLDGGDSGENIYDAILRYIAGARNGTADPARLARAVKAADGARWPLPIVRLLLDQEAMDDVRKAAAQGDADTQAGQNCEMNFYGGEREILHGAKPVAESLLKEAVDHCPKIFDEYRLALTELRRLRKAAGGR